MQAQQAILTFSEAERPLGERLLKIAIEIDRVEGYSEPHAIAIARTAEKLGARMGLHGVDLTALKFAALAHDLGERAMKRNYLLRPGPLNWEETLDLWRHPILGEQGAGELKLSRQTQLLIRWHHEWWNGGGYPDGLAGEAIPIGARIIRSVDSYFAFISNRPHRQRFDRAEAEQIIADLAGIEFDPQVVKLLLQVLAEERSDEPALEYSGVYSGTAIVADDAAAHPIESLPQTPPQTPNEAPNEVNGIGEIAHVTGYVEPQPEIPAESLNGNLSASTDAAPSPAPDEAVVEEQPETPAAVAQKEREKVEQ